MTFKIRYFVYLFFALFPLLNFLMLKFNHPAGLIWLGLDTVYYTPAYYAAPQLFVRAEMNILLPSLWGRCLALIMYCLVLNLLFKLKDKLAARRSL